MMNEELMSRLYDESKVYRDTEWGEKVQFFDHRKFAKLIIKECLNVVKEVRDDCWTELSTETIREYMKAQSDDTMIAIKKHFGMK